MDLIKIKKKIRVAGDIVDVSRPRWMRRKQGIRLAYYPGKNFGDMLSPLIVSKLLNQEVTYGHYRGADLLAVGSILNPLQQWGNKRCPVIWGSGLIEDGPNWTGDPVKLCAVRGELTLSRMRRYASDKVALGDPGLLIKEIFPDIIDMGKVYKLSIIPHMFDVDNDNLLSAVRKYDFINIIDPRNNPHYVISEIAKSEVVLSSSLHGLICSDALGVPNRWTPMSDKLEGGAYKFDDYYSVYNLDALPGDLSESIRNYDEICLKSDISSKLPNIQNSLIDSFPKEYLLNLYR